MDGYLAGSAVPEQPSCDIPGVSGDRGEPGVKHHCSGKAMVPYPILGRAALLPHTEGYRERRSISCHSFFSAFNFHRDQETIKD